MPKGVARERRENREKVKIRTSGEHKERETFFPSIRFYLRRANGDILIYGPPSISCHHRSVSAWRKPTVPLAFVEFILSCSKRREQRVLVEKKWRAILLQSDAPRIISCRLKIGRFIVRYEYQYLIYNLRQAKIDKSHGLSRKIINAFEKRSPFAK